MASLEGHLVPGIFFIIFALWWSFVTNIRFILTRVPPYSYTGTVTMPCICCPCHGLKRAPVESYVKLFFTLIGFLIETIAGLISYKPPDPYYIGQSADQGHQHGGAMATSPVNSSTEHLNHDHSMHTAADQGILIKSWFPMEINNAQHTTMYVAFMFGALIEILVHYRVRLPRFLEHAFGLLGFSVECFLFAFHLHGRSAIDVHVHTLLVFSILGCIIFTCLEIYNPSQILFTYGRCLFTLVQGTWFCQAGFVLYPPTTNGYWQWDPNNHMSIMMLTLAYCWHVMIAIAFLLFEFFLMSRLYANSKLLAAKWDELASIDEENLLSQVSGQLSRPFGHQQAKFLRLTNVDDEDSEGEQVEYDADTMHLNNIRRS